METERKQLVLIFYFSYAVEYSFKIIIMFFPSIDFIFGKAFKIIFQTTFIFVKTVLYLCCKNDAHTLKSLLKKISTKKKIKIM